MISQAQSTPASENRKKDELDEESLDPNVRGNSFRVSAFWLKPIGLALFFFFFFFIAHFRSHDILLFDLATLPKLLRTASVDK